MKKFLAEGVGTMFLVLLACGSAVFAAGIEKGIGGYGVGVCFGLTLICLAYAIGGISGCHVNPAVSLGVFLSGRMSGKDFVGYVVAQFIGATVGAFFLWVCVKSCPEFIFGGKTAPDFSLATNVVQTQNHATSTLALIVEALLTFFFVFVILGTTDSKKGAGAFAGLAIGIALGLVNIVGIPVDNCSVNPARSFGPAVFNPAAFADFWIMVVGPCVGAVAAALCWKGVAGTDKASIE